MLTNEEKRALRAVTHVFDPAFTNKLSRKKATEIVKFLRKRISRDTPEAHAIECRAGKRCISGVDDDASEVSDSEDGDDLSQATSDSNDDDDDTDDSFVVSDNHIDYDTGYETASSSEDARRSRRPRQRAKKRKVHHSSNSDSVESDETPVPRRKKRKRKIIVSDSE
jgi:hypothetical protein